MGTYYAIYAEVRVGNQWYNLNPLFQRTDGNIDVCPVISGRNWLREAYEELEEVSYTCGRPENLSKEVRSVFCHEEGERKVSYDIHLNDPVTKQIIELENPHFMRGGTYAIDGTKELSLNITYNYACVFCRPEVLGEKGIRSIYGKTGAESIPVLQKAIDALTDEVDSDYSESNRREC